MELKARYYYKDNGGIETSTLEISEYDIECMIIKHLRDNYIGEHVAIDGVEIENIKL